MKIKSKLCKSEFIQISKLFSPANFNYLALQDEDKINSIVNTFKSLCLEYPEFTLEKAYTEFYKVLSKKYKNEYIFKNIIFKDVILKNHNINDCVTVPEFYVGKSKADLAVFNGVSTVYEIKSEIDTTERLFSQLADYSSFFEFVNVVTCEKHLKKVEKIVSTEVGILIIDSLNKVHIYKEAVSNFQNITHKSLFYALRKNEYINLIVDCYGPIPIMPNTKIFNYCFDLFKEINIEAAYKRTLYYLKRRSLKKEHIELISELPTSLKSMTIQHGYNKKKCENIKRNIQKVFI
ncbi:hypothetical protein ATE47_12260 [Chryseobacterium sp. IHB B 17019]|uniref:sce7726 family protein n=1 Tax=Chryseobacterium sp. IHB B 17019 TaxID=1721091 RepID=UPI00072038FC|nr:sce7726 family protein [Chryseobacterium sp. IHB B 17019]ALR31245.1 hypothetical protein ATE47_12260 [Chryseobacterium sp. IHB B 17019]